MAKNCNFFYLIQYLLILLILEGFSNFFLFGYTYFPTNYSIFLILLFFSFFLIYFRQLFLFFIKILLYYQLFLLEVVLFHFKDLAYYCFATQFYICFFPIYLVTKASYSIIRCFLILKN